MAYIRAVILDVDGTLIDSNDAHTQSWIQVFGENGYNVTYDKVRRLIGMGADKLLPEAIGVEKDSPEGKKLTEARSEIFLKYYLPKLKPFPGARVLLERMRQEGIRLVVATSAKPDELGKLLKQAKVADLLPETTDSGEVQESKPAPDIVQVALKKTGFHPDEVMMLGDTPYDGESCTKAGVKFIAVRCGGWSDDELKGAGAIAIYNDPEDLYRQYDNSPLYQGLPPEQYSHKSEFNPF